MSQKQSFGPPRLEWAEDGSLIITKDRPSPVDLSRLLGSIWLPMIVGCYFVVIAIQVGFAHPWAAALLALLGLAIPPGPARAAWRRSQHIQFGTWRLDDAGIEYQPANGDRRRLAWGEVRRVLWGSTGGFRLVGPCDDIIRMRPDGISDADWKQVRDRVEAALSPRFDLAIRTHPVKIRLGRIFFMTLVLVAGAFGLAWALPHLTIHQLNWVAGLLGLIHIVGLGWFTTHVLVAGHRLNPIWRDPRPDRGEQDDPA